VTNRKTTDIERLKREYRALRASEHLAGRIHAQVAAGAGRDTRRRAAGPAVAALAAGLAAAALLVALPWQGGGEADIRPTSLTVLSLAAKSHAGGTVPGLSAIRGMTLPSAPARPVNDTGPAAPPPGDEEPEDLRNHSRNDEEKDHANS
jgi:hypothetical protein